MSWATGIGEGERAEQVLRRHKSDLRNIQAQGEGTTRKLVDKRLPISKTDQRSHSQPDSTMDKGVSFDDLTGSTVFNLLSNPIWPNWYICHSEF